LREILFRGKRMDNGEWVEGYYASIGKYHYILTGRLELVPYLGFEHFLVNPDTVGQFTGLTDENGVKIFEGDIIKWKYLCNDHLVYQVVYEKGTAGFVTRRNFNNRDGIDCYSDSVFDDDGDMSEVIGNIHDNPELLEVNSNERKSNTAEHTAKMVWAYRKR